jgi:hypothetical protein
MDSQYPDRFMELFERRKEPATVVNGAIFRLYSSMAEPFGPAECDYSLGPEQAARVLRSLGGKLLRTTTGFRPAGVTSEWYAVICSAFTPVESVSSSKRRSELRRGLRNCEVERIAAADLARTGYEVYRRAFDRYTGSEKPVAEPIFRNHILAGEGFEDVRQHWAVRCDGELAGYSSVYVFGRIEAAYSSVKLHPEYLKQYPSYALFYRLNEHYLVDRKVRYVNDGFRTIFHQTGLQRFLERNFGFENAYTGLEVVYSPPYRALVRATFPLRHLIGRFDERARAIYELERVARGARVQA